MKTLGVYKNSSFNIRSLLIKRLDKGMQGLKLQHQITPDEAANGRQDYRLRPKIKLEKCSFSEILIFLTKNICCFLLEQCGSVGDKFRLRKTKNTHTCHTSWLFKFFNKKKTIKNDGNTVLKQNKDSFTSKLAGGG